jgi:hypothetical protein
VEPTGKSGAGDGVTSIIVTYLDTDVVVDEQPAIPIIRDTAIPTIKQNLIIGKFVLFKLGYLASLNFLSTIP